MISSKQMKKSEKQTHTPGTPGIQTKRLLLIHTIEEVANRVSL
jgi:hypothetical protein